jgi:Holliday junction resolvase
VPTHYARGYAFERRVRQLLESLGCFVIRSAGSKGVADLVAIRLDATLLVQCKRQGAISSQEWNTLYDTAMRIGAMPILAQMRGARGTAMYLMTGRKVKRGDWPMELFSMV